MTTAIGYCRVSTQRQADSGLGLDAQRAAIEKYAKDHGLDVKWFSDEGVSGAAPIDQRPQLAAALDALGRNGILLVAKLDRLARDKFMAAWIEMRVQSRGGRIVSCAGEGTEDDGPYNGLFRSIIQAFATFERQLIGMRTKSAKAAHKANGGFIGGLAPYGFRRDGDKLVKDDGEQAAVALAKELRAQAHSWPGIADKLMEAGHKPRRAKRWHPSQVRRMVVA